MVARSMSAGDYATGGRRSVAREFPLVSGGLGSLSCSAFPDKAMLNPMLKAGVATLTMLTVRTDATASVSVAWEPVIRNAGLRPGVSIRSETRAEVLLLR